MNKYDEEINKILRKYPHPEQAISSSDQIQINYLRVQASYQEAIELINKGAKLRGQIYRKLMGKPNLQRIK